MNIVTNDISPETTFFALHFWCRKYRRNLTTFT